MRRPRADDPSRSEHLYRMPAEAGGGEAWLDFGGEWRVAVLCPDGVDRWAYLVSGARLHTMHVRVSAEEVERIDALAEAAGVDRATWVRSRAMGPG